MSPEQAAGRVDETDHRADQWALACIVWEMLSGRTPFVADDVSPLFYQITNLDPEPIGKRVANLPAAVEPVLLRALAKKPADRYPTIRDFSRAFEEAALGRPADLTPTPVNLSTDPWVTKTGTGLRPRASQVGPVASRDWPVVGNNTERDLVKQVTTFSHTTGELTQQTLVRRFRPVHALVVAAGLALVAGGFLFLRTGAIPLKPVPSLPAPPPPVVAPTPPPPAIEPLPSPTPPPPVGLEKERGKAKAAAEDRTAKPAKAGKGKVLKSPPRRRIFQDL
jgi:hypothetical protein